ncbi:MAG: YdbH domain-containing protein [Alphaproteobacteria bacterium]|nr:YdbH domain-containing protein [Alphaproteobacteria bacterium]
MRDALLKIATPIGSLKFSGSGRFSGGSLRGLATSVQPTILRGRGITAKLRSATLSAGPTGDLHITLVGDFAATNGASHFALRDASALVTIEALRWSAGSHEGYRFHGQLRADVHAAQMDAWNLAIQTVAVDLDTTGDVSTNGFADLIGGMTATGTMAGEEARRLVVGIPILGSDPTARQALASAMRQFSLRAGAIHLLCHAGQSVVALAEPAELSGNGATLRLSAPKGPLIHAAARILRGSAAFHLEGAKLPEVDFALTSYSYQPTAAGSTFSANTSIRTRFDLAGLRGASVSADGTLDWRSHRLAFVLDHCANIAAKAMMSKGQRVIGRTNLALCNGVPGVPLLSAEPGRWEVHATWKSLSTRLTRANVNLVSPQGTIVLSSRMGRGISGFVEPTQTYLSDLARPCRFAPAVATGRISMASRRVHGKFLFSGAWAPTIGTVVLAGSMKTGRWKAIIRANQLAFNPTGLQPKDLSPLLAPLSQVGGTASFAGSLASAPEGLTSEGVLTVRNLDFVGPPGAVHGTNGQMHFMSLIPLRTAPNQTLSITKVDWVTPLTNLAATFELGSAHLAIQNATANLAGGRVSLGPLSLSLVPGSGGQGELRLHKIDIGTLIAASNLAGKITASGQVTGILPIRYGPKGLRIVEGHIATVGPGRLSIAPGTWSDTQESADPGAVRGFAYQALQHLAIDKLDGTVNSLSNGRLRLLLHIRGYYDPENPRAAEVDLLALLRGRAFDHTIPLPKGTKINLTLDLSLNFAELLAEYRKVWAESLAISPTPP